MARNLFTGLLGIDLDSLTQDETVCFPVRQSVLKSDSLLLTPVPHIWFHSRL